MTMLINMYMYIKCVFTRMWYHKCYSIFSLWLITIFRAGLCANYATMEQNIFATPRQNKKLY